MASAPKSSDLLRFRKVTVGIIGYFWGSLFKFITRIGLSYLAAKMRGPVLDKIDSRVSILLQ